jgi:2-amino-4-hydroxy-6-hydroxymethyldihydropteridine diphosphokinase
VGYSAGAMDYAIGLGGNLGSRENHLQAGLELLAETAGCALVVCSSLYESEPVGPPQPHYLNAAARIESGLEADALLARLLEIEQLLGRERRERWGARTLDLDILWARVPVDSPDLQIPHPRLMQRWFALTPLLEILPELAPGAPQLAMAGRRLHPLALEPRVEQRADGGRQLMIARALDRADALAAVLSAAGRATWPLLTCRDSGVELLRVRAEAERQPGELLEALRALVERGFGIRRVLVSNSTPHMINARVIGAAHGGASRAFAQATLGLADDPLGARAELRLAGPR